MVINIVIKIIFANGLLLVDHVAQVLALKMTEKRNFIVFPCELIAIFIAKNDYHTYAYYKTNLELLELNQNLESRFNFISNEFASTKKELAERDKKIKEQEEEILQLKNQLMIYEHKINVMTEENSAMQLKLFSKNDSLENQRLTIEVLEKQIFAINEALNNTQASLENILSQKSRLVSAKFQEFMNDDLQFKEIRIPEYFTHSYNFNFEPFYNKIPPSRIMNPTYNDSKEQNISECKQLSEEGPASELIFDKNGLKKQVPCHLDSEMSPRSNKGPSEFNEFQDSTNNQGKDSFISHFDLPSAFANASNVFNVWFRYLN